jgi:hypothetical protein
MLIELFEHRTAERRFARADFARELHKALPPANSVKEMVEGLAMLGGVKQEARIWRNVKGRFCQAVVLEIHPDFLAESKPEGRERRTPAPKRQNAKAGPDDEPQNETLSHLVVSDLESPASLKA